MKRMATPIAHTNYKSPTVSAEHARRVFCSRSTSTQSTTIRILKRPEISFCCLSSISTVKPAVSEMARRFGAGATPVIGVSEEGDSMMIRQKDKSPTRPELARWSSVEVALDQMSKWLVAGGLCFTALWKHDVESMWVFYGAIANNLLSRVLKKKLNHERPTPALRSDPGMPSSHAQSMFYAATMLVFSLFNWLGTNSPTIILLPAILSAATYLSWLRVSHGLHTLNQVTVGAAVGFTFGALWFKLWHSLVKEALPTSPLFQSAVVLGSTVFCVGFVIRHWLTDTRRRFDRH